MPIAVPTFGSAVNDSTGKQIGVAAFDPNTGKPLAGTGDYNPNTGSAIPTSAPTGQTSTNAPVASPVSVVSSSNASNSLASTVIPVMNSAQADIATQNAQKAITAQQNTKTTTTTPTPPVSPSDQAAQDIANTPDAGYKFSYDKNTGERTQIPLSDSSSNHNGVDYNPSTAQGNVVATTSTGINYKQFQDGTYGRFDVGGNYIGQAQGTEVQNAQDAQGVLTKLNQALTGSYPLNPVQQAQIDSTKAQFQELVDQQTKANANLTGGTTVAQNLYGIGNTTIGLGAIKQTVDDGISKIGDIQSKLASSVSTMTDAFDKDNLSALQDAYKTYSDNSTALQASVDKVHDDMVAAAKDARDYNLNIQKFNEQSQQDTFTNDLDTKKFTEQEKTDAFDMVYKQEDLALRQRANDIASGNVNIPTVTTTSSGKPDPQSQAQFLATLPQGTATMVKNLTNYTSLPSNLSQKGGAKTALLALAHQYDPSYDEALAPARAAYIKNLQSGSIQQGIQSGNKVIAHLSAFSNDVSSLTGNNTPFAKINSAEKSILSPFNSKLQTNISKANIVKTGLTDEFAKYFKGTGTSDVKSIDDWGKNLSTNEDKSQLKGTVQGGLDLFSGQFNAIVQNYTTTIGHPPDVGEILQPDSIQKLSALKDQGYDIEIPGINYTDAKTYIKNDPNGANNLKQVINAYPNLSQADALQLAQSL